jgi:hypothetical protein
MLVCWQCGASLTYLSLPFTRRDLCKQCSAALHVCKLCLFYDVSKAKHCREPIADEVQDKQRANFCDYFKEKPNAYVATSQDTVQRAKLELEKLFGKS